MGFSWAFHFAHEAHVALANLALPTCPFLRDRRPVPQLGGSFGALVIYADNAIHMGVVRDQVDAQQTVLSHVVNAAGLDTREILEAGTLGEGLGVRYNGGLGVLAPTPAREWRLDCFLQAICGGAQISGSELRRI
eukprot:2689852-Heterocapsa_arctica.AAC.1